MRGMGPREHAGELRTANVDRERLLERLTEDVRLLYEVGAPRENRLWESLRSEAIMHHNKLNTRVAELEKQVDAMVDATEDQKESARNNSTTRSQDSELLSAPADSSSRRAISLLNVDIAEVRSAIALLSRRMDDAVAHSWAVSEAVSEAGGALSKEGAASKEELKKLSEALCTKFLAYKAADVTNLESQMALINTEIIALGDAATETCSDCFRLRTDMDAAKAARAADGVVMARRLRESEWAHSFLLANMHRPVPSSEPRTDPQGARHEPARGGSNRFLHLLRRW